MAVDKDYIDWIMGLLEPIEGVSKRAMFGGYGIFADKDMFALVSKEPALYMKVDDSNRKEYDSAGSKKYGPMPYFLVPADVLEDQAEFVKWATKSIKIAHATSKKK